MKLKKLEERVEVPKNVTITIDKNLIKIKGPKGEVEREIKNPKVFLKKEEDELSVYAENATKKEKKEVNTYAAHIKNMIKGASQGHVYELKICSGHFPMNVALSGAELIIKNFIGEKYPRKLKIKAGVKVIVSGEKITVEHINKEIAGQTAADIEQLTRRPGFDTRIFQDGIYMTIKDGKEL